MTDPSEESKDRPLRRADERLITEVWRARLRWGTAILMGGVGVLALGWLVGSRGLIDGVGVLLLLGSAVVLASAALDRSLVSEMLRKGVVTQLVAVTEEVGRGRGRSVWVLPKRTIRVPPGMRNLAEEGRPIALDVVGLEPLDGDGGRFWVLGIDGKHLPRPVQMDWEKRPGAVGRED